MNRRGFIKGSLLAGSGIAVASRPPFERLVATVVDNLIPQAAAATAGLDTKYVYMNLIGAPPRWGFDHFFQTSPSETAVQSSMVSTHFLNNAPTYTQPVYQLSSVNGMMVPYIWTTNVASRSGGLRPLSDLLKNMIVFRGYGTDVDGHPSNGAKQTNPVAGAGSLTGTVAEASSTLMKAIQFPAFGSFSGYNSLAGVSLNVFPYSGNVNYASTLMNPFGSRAETSAANPLRTSYADLINTAQGRLRQIASQDHAQYSAIATDQQTATAKIKTGISNLQSLWSPLYNKYLMIAQTMFKDRSTPGLNDKPVIVGGDGATDAGSAAWLWFTDAGELVLTPGQDLRNMMNNVDVTSLANEFAFAEFVLTQNLTSGLELYIQQPQNLSAYAFKNYSGSTFPSTLKTGSLFFDQHFTGVGTGTYINSCLYRALGACILELRDQLISAGLFDRTVIHLGQEFGRSARADGSGSDHSFNGMISSAIAGSQTAGPWVIGNVLSNGSGGYLPANYSGSFGYRAPTSVSGSTTTLTPAHVTSTLATLLKLPTNPWIRTSAPLVTLNSAGQLVRQADGKLVAS